MSKLRLFPVLMASALGLAACDEGITPYVRSPNTIIATSHDTGGDSVGLADGDAAVVYDPDGCQGWLIDDGVEGYSGRRFDPVSGLPICNNLYPPGTVVGNYQSQSPGIPDFVPPK
jgi:hypothetical protein